MLSAYQPIASMFLNFVGFIYLSFWPGENGIIKVCGLGVEEIKHPRTTNQMHPFTKNIREVNKDALV